MVERATDIRRVNHVFYHTASILYQNIYQMRAYGVDNTTDIDLMLFAVDEHRAKSIQELRDYLCAFLKEDFLDVCKLCMDQDKTWTKPGQLQYRAFTRFIRSNGYQRYANFRSIPKIHKDHNRDLMEVHQTFYEELKKVPDNKQENRALRGEDALSISDYEMFSKAMQADICHEGFFDKYLMYDRIVDLVCVLTYLEEAFA